MTTKSAISWTEQTWNPIVGCSVVSPGCTNCYAMKMANRLQAMGVPQYLGTVKPSRGGPVWTGKVALHEAALLAPLKRRKPTIYFVNSMGDLFHEDVPDEWIDRVFAVMAMCPQHTFQVLTKRSKRMREYMTNLETPKRKFDILLAARRVGARLSDTMPINTKLGALPLPNVWLGVSAEDQTRADERIPDLLATPAAIRFVSAEPLLGPIALVDRDPIQLATGKKAPMENQFYVSFLRGWGIGDHALPALDWVITGGESGPNARPMHPDWARSLRDQCEAAGTAFHFKQWGEWVSNIDRDIDDPDWRAEYGLTTRKPKDYAILNLAGGTGFHGERVQMMRHVGTSRAGRLLDGRTHDAMPEAE